MKYKYVGICNYGLFEQLHEPDGLCVYVAKLSSQFSIGSMFKTRRVAWSRGKFWNGRYIAPPRPANNCNSRINRGCQLIDGEQFWQENRQRQEIDRRIDCKLTAVESFWQPLKTIRIKILCFFQILTKWSNNSNFIFVSNVKEIINNLINKQSIKANM